jgi:hypothetical protein
MRRHCVVQDGTEKICAFLAVIGEKAPCHEGDTLLDNFRTCSSLCYFLLQ